MVFQHRVSQYPAVYPAEKMLALACRCQSLLDVHGDAICWLIGRVLLQAIKPLCEFMRLRQEFLGILYSEKLQIPELPADAG